VLIVSNAGLYISSPSRFDVRTTRLAFCRNRTANIILGYYTCFCLSKKPLFIRLRLVLKSICCFSSLAISKRFSFNVFNWLLILLSKEFKIEIIRESMLFFQYLNKLSNMRIYYFYCITPKRNPKKLNTSILRPCNFLQ